MFIVRCCYRDDPETEKSAKGSEGKEDNMTVSLIITTNAAITPENKDKVLGDLSGMAADATGKAEAFVQIGINTAHMSMSGISAGMTAMCDFRHPGGFRNKKETCEKMCQILKQHLNIPQERIYINFFDVPACDWGWNGNLMGK
eukprot:GFYU01009950.1.p1 GENE.GFYU01009950.1~~GFYU01009950.1.p1  ORF type:complete len:144 (-),score=48.33 GFYU01009950.1:35-466(-)